MPMDDGDSDAKWAHFIPNTHHLTFPWADPPFLSQGAITDIPCAPQRVSI